MVSWIGEADQPIISCTNVPDKQGFYFTGESVDPWPWMSKCITNGNTKMMFVLGVAKIVKQRKSFYHAKDTKLYLTRLLNSYFRNEETLETRLL